MCVLFWAAACVNPIRRNVEWARIVCKERTAGENLSRGWYWWTSVFRWRWYVLWTGLRVDNPVQWLIVMIEMCDCFTLPQGSSR